jgi:hypothetical protein
LVQARLKCWDGLDQPVDEHRACRVVGSHAGEHRACHEVHVRLAGATPSQCLSRGLLGVGTTEEDIVWVVW